MMDAAHRRGDGTLTAEYALQALESLAEFDRLAPTNDEVVYIRVEAQRYLTLARSRDGHAEGAREVEQAMTTLEQAFDAKIDCVKLRMLHLDLLKSLKLTGSKAMSRVKESVDRLIELPAGHDPWVLIRAGLEYHGIAEHGLAVDALERAKKALAITGRPLPQDTGLALVDSTQAKDQQ